MATHRPAPTVPVELPVPLKSVRGKPGRLLGAALVCLSAFGLTCLVFVRTRAGQRLDSVLLPRADRGGGYEQQTLLMAPAKAVLSGFGNPVVLGALLGAVLLVGAWNRRPWAGVAGVGLVPCSVVLAGAAKLVIARPDLEVAGSTTHNSFPSGHVAAAAGILFAFLLVSPSRARWWFAVPGAAGVSLVAAATMIAGWHRFSDAVGAVLLVAVLFCLAAAVLAGRSGGSGAGASGAVVSVVGPVHRIRTPSAKAAGDHVAAGIAASQPS